MKIRLFIGLFALLVLTLIACTGSSDTQEPPPRPNAIFEPRGVIDEQELDAIRAFLTERIERAIENKGIPSISIGLYDAEGSLWTDGFGLASTEDNKTLRASRRTVYRVGSVSKLFTDIAVMQRVEKGELNLDAPVTDVLPSFQPSNPFDEPITLRQLMCHRSGLVREPPIGNYFDDDEPSLADTVASLNQTALVHAPGTVAKYSNAGIAVVGLVLETVAGVPFDQAVREAVLDPLGMTSSDFLPSARVTDRVAEAQMRTLDRRRMPAPIFQLGMSPAGSLYSTVDDLALFSKELLQRERLLSPEGFEEMFTPQFAEPDATRGFGLGFGIGTLDFDGTSLRRLGHGGAIYGFSTQLDFLPDEGLGVAVTSSLDGSNGLIAEIADQALKMLLTAKRQQATEPNGQPGKLAELIESQRRNAPQALTQTQVDHFAGPYQDANSDSFRLLERATKNGQPGLILDTGRSVRNLGWLEQDGKASLVVDDVGGGGQLVIATANDGTPELRRGTHTYRRAEPGLPSEAPERLRSVLGKYGWEHLPLFLFERDGDLWAVIELLEVTKLRDLEPGSSQPSTFAIDTGMYVGEKLVIQRNPSGTVERVMLGAVAFERGEADLADGATFRIDPILPVEELRKTALAATPPDEGTDFRASDLVELTTLEESIHLDVRYATTNNFMSSVFYQQPRAFLQRPAAEAVARAHKALSDLGFGLLIHDAYRPWYVTKMFWDATPQDKKIFVANPDEGSRHNRGCAVDLTLYELSTGAPVQMVGGYDEMTDRSFPDYLGGTQRQRSLRELLRQAMEAEGFSVYEFEWWHFDYQDWREYGIGNKTFEQL